MISIIVPTYEMYGRGVEFLNELMNSIDEQIFVPYEVIVTDDSEDDEIRKYCSLNNIQYYKHPGPKGACRNFNYGLSKATGDIIKPMFQDDQFQSKDCLKLISQMKSEWCCLTSAHIGGRTDHIPYAETDILELAKGRNTYGSPSAVAWRNNKGTVFDESLIWLFDCDLYARMVLIYGPPEFIDAKVLIREWEGSVTNTIGRGQIRVTELEYIIEKFKPLI